MSRKRKHSAMTADGLKEAAQSLTDAREAGRVAKVADDAPNQPSAIITGTLAGVIAVPEHFTLDAKPRR